jgi:hypothetical protein
MEDYDRENSWSRHPDFPNIQDSTGNVRLSHAVSRTHTLSTLHFVAGLLQLFLGLAVVTVSILGLIKPLWVSLLLTMVASVTSMIGLYLVYITVSRYYDSHSLIRSAVKRVMKAKN